MKIVGFHRLFQREQTVVRPDPIQRFQEGLFRGFDSAVTQLGECFGIPFPVQNRSNDCHATFSNNVTDVGMEFHIHQFQ
jgi:hypothetical protein